MAVGCGPKLAKFVLFVFNALFWVSGLVLIIIGSVFLANGRFKYIDQIINSSTNRNILVLFILVGVVIFAIAFCGCWGAIKESRGFLGTYIIFLIVIIVAEVVFGVLAIVNKNAVQEKFDKEFSIIIKDRYGVLDSNNKTDSTVMAMVDNIQKLFQCCGSTNYTDWRQSKWYNTANQTVPLSCCVPGVSDCWNNTNANTTYLAGCGSQIKAYVDRNQPIVIGVSLGVALFEMFVVVCAICLCRNTDRRQAL